MMTFRNIAGAAIAGLLILFGMSAVVENQARAVTGTVTTEPSGLLQSSGRPIEGVRIEYSEDGSAAVHVTTTDASGNFSFPAGSSRAGIVTASKSGLATVSVGWPPLAGSDLQIALPEPATLTGRIYDMATRRAVGRGLVSVMVDHSVNPVSASVFMDGGRYEFTGLLPGSATLAVNVQDYAPTYTTVSLAAGERQQADIGLLLDGSVIGTVVDADGSAVSGATISAEYLSFDGAAFVGHYIGGFTRTGTDGRFRVTGIVPDESFVVHAELDGRRISSSTLRATPGTPIEGVVLRFN